MSLKIYKIEKQEGEPRICVAQMDDNKNGLYIPYGECMMLEKILEDLYNEKLSSESSFTKKRYEFLSYLRQLIKKNILSSALQAKEEETN